MIERIYKSIALVALPILLLGQITVDKNSLPDFGDTIRYKTDRSPSISILEPGSDLAWDFSKLTGPYVDEYIFGVPSSEQELHTNVDMILRKNGEPLSLLRWYGDDLQEIGRYEDELIKGKISELTSFSSPAMFRKGYMEIGARDVDDYQSTLIWAANNLPIMLINDLPKGVDSVRLDLKSKVTTVADAWGTLYMPFGTHDALRLRRDILVESDFSIFSEGVWHPFNSARLMNQFFTTTTRHQTEYHYYTEASQMPIVIIQVDDFSKPYRVQYQIDRRIDPDATPFNKEIGLYAHPNPTFGDIRFDFYGYDPGNYRITIYNTILKELWSESYNIAEDDTVDLDFSYLQKGSYYYSIENGSGDRILIKKLNIIKP